jgi:hypothetical protein
MVRMSRRIQAMGRARKTASGKTESTEQGQLFTEESQRGQQAVQSGDREEGMVWMPETGRGAQRETRKDWASSAWRRVIGKFISLFLRQVFNRLPRLSLNSAFSRLGLLSARIPGTCHMVPRSSLRVLSTGVTL